MSTSITSSQNSGRQINGGVDVRNGSGSHPSNSGTGVVPASSSATHSTNDTSSDQPNMQAGVHPSAVGSGTTPKMGSSSNDRPNGDTTTNSDTMPGSDAEYPEQKHAGKVGYGPNYNQGVGFTEKVVGLKEEIKGKLTKNHELVQHGKERRTGELKHKELENDDDDPFANPEEKKKPPLDDVHKSSSTSIQEERRDKEEAATVSPEGTNKVETQRKGEAVENVKQIG